MKKATPEVFYKMILVSCSFFLCMACNPLAKYEDDVVEWEDEILQLDSLNNIENHSERSILFTGSSSIRLWDSIDFDMAPYEVIKRGYGGAKFSDFAWYADRIIYPHQFSAIVIFVGNDVAGEESDKEPKEVARLFKHVIKNIRKKYIENPIFLIEITPTQSRWDVWPEIKDVNAVLKSECDNHPKVYFIETSNAFLKSDGKPDTELFKTDSLHLNRNGYILWSGIIKNSLKEHL